MFESIKLRIIKGRQLNPFATAKVLQEHEDRLNALEEGSGNENTSSEDTLSNNTEETQTLSKRNLSFTVNDGNNPIEGATVTIGTITGTTGSAGGCTLQDVEEGEQSVTISKDGFTTKTETITVSSSNTSFTISLVAA